MKHEAQLDTKYKGKSFVDIIKSRGIIPGVKVDKGTVALPRTSPEETATQGLDGLLERSKEYYDRGARFSKWRSRFLGLKDTVHVADISCRHLHGHRYYSLHPGY